METSVTSTVKRCPAILVFAIDIGPTLKQVLHNLDLDQRSERGDNKKENKEVRTELELEAK
jgi:hypothetical protein